MDPRLLAAIRKALTYYGDVDQYLPLYEEDYGFYPILKEQGNLARTVLAKLEQALSDKGEQHG